MEFTKCFIFDVEEVIGSKIINISVIDSSDESFLVIEMIQGFLVLDSNFDEVDVNYFKSIELDYDDLFNINLIDSNTHKSLELIDDFDLKGMDEVELEEMYNAIGKLLKK